MKQNTVWVENIVRIRHNAGNLRKRAFKNTVGKRRKCWLPAFSLFPTEPAFSPFPTVFLKALFLMLVESQECAVKVCYKISNHFLTQTQKNPVFYSLKTYIKPIKHATKTGIDLHLETGLEKVPCKLMISLLLTLSPYNLLTLSQTTNFTLFQTERVCKRQF